MYTREGEGAVTRTLLWVKKKKALAETPSLKGKCGRTRQCRGEKNLLSVGYKEVLSHSKSSAKQSSSALFRGFIWAHFAFLFFILYCKLFFSLVTFVLVSFFQSINNKQKTRNKDKHKKKLYREEKQRWRKRRKKKRVWKRRQKDRGKKES